MYFSVFEIMLTRGQHFKRYNLAGCRVTDVSVNVLVRERKIEQFADFREQVIANYSESRGAAVSQTESKHTLSFMCAVLSVQTVHCKWRHI